MIHIIKDPCSPSIAHLEGIPALISKRSKVFARKTYQWSVFAVHSVSTVQRVSNKLWLSTTQCRIISAEAQFITTVQSPTNGSWYEIHYQRKKAGSFRCLPLIINDHAVAIFRQLQQCARYTASDW